MEQDLGPTQPCSLSLTAFPYSSASEEESETLQRPVLDERDATSSPPQATRKYYSPPPLTRYSIQDTYSQHSGQPYESDHISESSIGQSPKLSSPPAPITPNNIVPSKPLPQLPSTKLSRSSLALIAFSVLLLLYSLGFFFEMVQIRNLITGASELLPKNIE